MLAWSAFTLRAGLPYIRMVQWLLVCKVQWVLVWVVGWSHACIEYIHIASRLATYSHGAMAAGLDGGLVIVLNLCNFFMIVFGLYIF